MNKPKILHIPQWYPNPDDIQLGIFIQKQIIATSQHCNNLVLSIVGSKNISELSLSIKETENIKEIQVVYSTKGNIYKRLKQYLKALQAGLSAVADNNFYPDIVHCHIAGKNLWVAEKYFKDTPIILSEHWSGYLDGRFDAISKLKKKKRIQRISNCKEIIAVSHHLAEAIKNKGIIPKISIVDNIIETKAIRSEERNSEFTFLMVCDLVDKTKNISGALEAFSKYITEDPSSRFKIVGDGEDKKYLQKLVNELNLNERVEFKGRFAQDKVLEYYAEVDCLIVNSQFETYSMVTAEAIMSGVPVIATRCGGPEQFINEKNGLLVDLNSTDQLKNAMLQIQSKSLISNSIVNSLNTHPTKEVVCAQLMKVYQAYL